jgi:hypothetical protein
MGALCKIRVGDACMAAQTAYLLSVPELRSCLSKYDQRSPRAPPPTLGSRNARPRCGRARAARGAPEQDRGRNAKPGAWEAGIRLLDPTVFYPALARRLR